ncbi:MAG: metalloregulator ArsR/SmtB family transcription factor [Vicinamibacterales bacterium]|nr:metalloregulator ArsR/SmtB family transcription factor [Vicinamibacterales bacterium]
MFDAVAPDLDLVAESTRRHILALIGKEGELCVCELVAALADSQPGVSRHLALLREGGWLATRREGTFVFYRLDAIPRWAKQIVDALAEGGVPREVLRASRARLAAFAGRPARVPGRAA